MGAVLRHYWQPVLLSSELSEPDGLPIRVRILGEDLIAFRDSAGKWSAQGQLKWPRDTAHAKPGPIRVCYPNVALRNRAVYFVGVSDVLEPNPAWRKFKRELTGQQWDYDFRRLFYTWTPDITKQPFAEWVEIASRDATGGHVQPGDLWLSPNGDAHLIWSERAIDERLR